jgi:hypothetical protein
MFSLVKSLDSKMLAVSYPFGLIGCAGEAVSQFFIDKNI